MRVLWKQTVYKEEDAIGFHESRIPAGDLPLDLETKSGPEKSRRDGGLEFPEKLSSLTSQMLHTIATGMLAISRFHQPLARPFIRHHTEPAGG
jgi:hypothetical protein